MWWESDTGTLWIYYNDGTSSQWVAINSTASNPTGPVLLSSQTVASPAVFVNFTSLLTSAYDEYEIHFFDVLPDTNNVYLAVQIGQLGVYKNDPNYWAAENALSSAGTNTPSGGTTFPNIPLTLANLSSSTTGRYVAGTIKIRKPSSSLATFKGLEWSLNYFSSGVNLIEMTGVGAYTTSAAAIDSIRFFCSAGNIAAGTFKLYGIP
jgi:hypothetical protein